MATIALMIGGAILNATAFIGGSYIAKSLSSSDESDAERKRHDEALETFQKDSEQYRRRKQEFEDWEIKRDEAVNKALENFKTTDEALKYYKSTHPDFDENEPAFTDYYQPKGDQKKGELIYVGTGMLALGYLANKLF